MKCTCTAHIEPGDLLSIRQTAELLGCSLLTVRKNIKKGQIPAAKVLGEWRVNRRALLAPFESSERDA